MTAGVAAAVAADAGRAVLPTRWTLSGDGAITWRVTPDTAHRDFIEMDGEQVAVVIRYGVANGVFSVNHDVVWPMLRFHPNLTDSHLRRSFGEDAVLDDDNRFSPDPFPTIRVRSGEGWWPIRARTLNQVAIMAMARFEGTLVNEDGTAPLGFERAIFPSTRQPAVIDIIVITNKSTQDVDLAIDEFEAVSRTSAKLGVYGAYRITQRVIGTGVRRLRPAESTTTAVVLEAHPDDEPLSTLDIAAEQKARRARVNEIVGRLVLVTPDPVLNTAFTFAKVHTTESIFRTKVGLLQSPGGGTRYYAAIWANDQAEYTNPFFGMLGDPIATEATINSFRQFARFMNNGYRPIPSSIIAEGDGFWNGAGDRGDMAMIAYGATRFALANGDRRAAESLWPLIEWCLEYLKRKVTDQGVVASDSDELEGRFPAGKANLNTSSLYYDALRSASMLGTALGKPRSRLDDYLKRAIALKGAIEHYFGAQIEGLATYRYYDKADLADDPDPEVRAYTSRPDPLRAWIATPLAMEIFDRKSGTIDALFSSRLWTPDGVATEEDQSTYWDRATLYALRGVLAAGATQRGLERLQFYSNRRLLGDHVPYPFEAYPEGGKAQLAAESALYCRVITEGLFGIRPTGLDSFDLTPRLPEEWPSMALKNVHAFGTAFDLDVERASAGKMRIVVTSANRPKKVYIISDGETQKVILGRWQRSQN